MFTILEIRHDTSYQVKQMSLLRPNIYYDTHDDVAAVDDVWGDISCLNCSIYKLDTLK